MKWIAIALGLSALAPLSTPDAVEATVAGPKVLLIGRSGFSGSIRAGGYVCAGFAEGPIVAVHVNAAGVRVHSVDVALGKKGEAVFSYQMDYEGTSPGSFPVEITVSSGTGNTGDGVEKFLVTARRL